jgi:pyruvate dehydrogenase E2 component (dihydrolipoamide acetyltransferase)
VAPGDRVFISPLARRLAREAGLAWQGLTGSGPLGRILAADVEKAKLNPPAPAVAAAAGGDFPAWVSTRLLPPSSLWTQTPTGPSPFSC